MAPQTIYPRPFPCRDRFRFATAPVSRCILADGRQKNLRAFGPQFFWAGPFFLLVRLFAVDVNIDVEVDADVDVDIDVDVNVTSTSSACACVLIFVCPGAIGLLVE